MHFLLFFSVLLFVFSALPFNSRASNKPADTLSSADTDLVRLDTLLSKPSPVYFDESALDTISSRFYLKHTLELSAASNTYDHWGNKNQSLSYKPEINFSNYAITNDLVFTGNAIFQLAGNLYYPYSSTDGYGPNDNNLDFSVYRLWGRLTYDGMVQATLGYQQIKMGNGIIYKPLSWFDDTKFYDNLKISPARNALLVTIDPSLNTRFMMWGMYANDNNLAYNYLATDSNSFSFGGRAEYMHPFFVAGISFNQRKVDPSSLKPPADIPQPPLPPIEENPTAFAFGAMATENAYAIDLRLNILLLTLYSDFMFTNISNITPANTTVSGTYNKIDQNAGLFLLLPINDRNYFIGGEYYYSKPIVSDSIAAYYDVYFRGYDIIFGVAPTTIDQLRLLYVAQITTPKLAPSYSSSTVMASWSRNYAYASAGLNLFMTKQSSLDSPIYGFQLTFKYFTTNDFWGMN